MSGTSNSNSIGSANSPKRLSSSHVNVCVRIRPLLKEEIFRGHESLAWSWDQNIIHQNSHASKRSGYYDIKDERPVLGTKFQFDQVFRPEHTNEYIFDTSIKNLVRQTILGFHGSVFTYGQTASGKTYTMSGNTYAQGIIPMAVQHCFQLIQEYPEKEFLFRVSYLEVYNEQVKDLLNTEPTTIKIQHGAKVGTVLTGVKEEVVLSPEHVMALLAAGNAKRHVGSTEMNEKSSRAHTLFKLIVESTARQRTGGGKSVIVSSLSMADLAGSENAKMTHSTGLRAKEAKYINQSLLTLSTIIHKLSEDRSKDVAGGQGHAPIHMPYRDSKLTRLMQSSLSGEANIVIICTISPTLNCFEETHNTLKFAARAKRVKVDAKVNESVDDKTLLRAYRLEIEQLKEKLRSMEQQQATSAQSLTPRESNPNGDLAAAESDEESDSGENMEYVLQMISEMERMILKADSAVASNTDGGNKTPPRSSFTEASAGAVVSANRIRPPSATTISARLFEEIPPTPSETAVITPRSHASTEPIQSASDLASKETHAPSPTPKPQNLDLGSIPSLQQRAQSAPELDSTGGPLTPRRVRAFSLNTQFLSTVQSPTRNGISPLPTDKATAILRRAIASTKSQDSSWRIDRSGGSTTPPRPDASMDRSSPRQAALSANFDTTKVWQNSTRPHDSDDDEDEHGAMLQENRSESTLSLQRATNANDKPRSTFSLPSEEQNNPTTIVNPCTVSAFPLVHADISSVSTEIPSESIIQSTVIQENNFDLNDNPSTDASESDQTSGDHSGEKVLSNVRNMLSLLKAHVARSTHRKGPQGSHFITPRKGIPTPATVSQTKALRKSFTEGDTFASDVSGIALGGREDSNLVRSCTTSPVNLLAQTPERGNSINLPNGFSDSSVIFRNEITSDQNTPIPPNAPSTTPVTSIAAGGVNPVNVQLSLNLRLKEADNRFLQDEIEKKDQMLALLSDGLKEVESNHQQWIREKDILIQNLTRANDENALLRTELARLQDLLDARNKELYSLTGVSADAEEY